MACDMITQTCLFYLARLAKTQTDSNCLSQDCGVGDVRSRRFLGGVGVGFLTTLGGGFFVRLRLRMSNWIIFYITLLNWDPVKMVQFLLKLLLKQRFLAV